jgi:hypothetical protein
MAKDNKPKLVKLSKSGDRVIARDRVIGKRNRITPPIQISVIRVNQR